MATFFRNEVVKNVGTTPVKVIETNGATRATVIGLNHKFKFKPTKMSSPDIRAGVSLLLAALAADGESTIENIAQIDRGYENIDSRLNAIGAQITRFESTNI